jgi:hypothetical protein
MTIERLSAEWMDCWGSFPTLRSSLPVGARIGDDTVARGHQRDTSTVDVQVTVALAAIGRRRRVRAVTLD